MQSPKQGKREKPDHITIVFSTAFTESVDALLSDKEQRALCLLLTEDPLSGTTVSGLPGLLRLLYARTTIYYCVSEGLEEVYLLSIEPDDSDSPPPSKEEKSLLEKLLKALALARGLKWLLDNL